MSFTATPPTSLISDTPTKAPPLTPTFSFGRISGVSQNNKDALGVEIGNHLRTSRTFNCYSLNPQPPHTHLLDSRVSPMTTATPNHAMQLIGSARHGSCFPQTHRGSYRAALRLYLILISLDLGILQPMNIRYVYLFICIL